MTYDTGSELEEQIAAMYPAVFNGNAGDADELPHESFDTRSDNRVFTSHPQVEMFIFYIPELVHFRGPSRNQWKWAVSKVRNWCLWGSNDLASLECFG